MTRQKDEQGIQSVHTALRLLEALSRNRNPMGVTEIARRMGTPKARVYRHLRTLLTDGYVDQDQETEKYRLGIKLYHLGRAAGDQMDLLTEARRVMQGLAGRYNLSVSLGQPIDEGVFIIDIVRTDSPFEISTRPGFVLPFHATAQGKVVLAHASQARVDRVLSAPLEKLTPHTVTDPEALRGQIRKAKLAGWAVAPEETLPGLNALAAPILAADGKIVATIAIIGTVQNLPKRPPRMLTEAILEGAHIISLALGYHEPPNAVRV